MYFHRIACSDRLLCERFLSQEREPDLPSSRPASGPLAGPSGSPRVLRLEQPERAPTDRRSLFARQMDRLRVGASRPVPPTETASSAAAAGALPSRLVTGAGLGGAAAGEERERIHRENLLRLQGLSSAELEEERERLLRELGELFPVLRAKLCMRLS